MSNNKWGKTSEDKHKNTCGMCCAWCLEQCGQACIMSPYFRCLDCSHHGKVPRPQKKC